MMWIHESFESLGFSVLEGKKERKTNSKFGILKVLILAALLMGMFSKKKIGTHKWNKNTDRIIEHYNL